ncbi:MAG: hypothetical protein ABI898_09460 [Sphingomonadales bacterium]
MGIVAFALFVGMLTLGPDWLGYADTDGTVRIALVVSYLLGALTAYRASKT